MDVLLEFARVFQCGKSVDVNYAIDAIIFVLHFDVILNSTEIIADVLSASRSCTREDAFLHFYQP